MVLAEPMEDSTRILARGAPRAPRNLRRTPTGTMAWKRKTPMPLAGNWTHGTMIRRIAMTATEQGCGRPAKGSDPKDSTLPCGTRIYWGERGNQTQTVLLCDKCKGAK